MTTVLCLTHNGKTVMASDSAGTSSNRQWISNRPKIIHVGEFTFGYSGSYREAQIVEFEFSPLEKGKNESDRKYVYRNINKIKEIFENNKTTDDETQCAGAMIVYYNNVIYLFETDYQIDEWAAQFEAIGSGSHYAIGAMTALLNLGNKYSADEIARIAIETSMKHDPNTGGHVFVEEL